ncbi:MAG: hypothetical protein A2Y69_06705 [Candidatus Aminicenantes bacterium RBG_13_59_9]|jgi:hypothetical protein|nr:MAG: hypothetical protein A2Y69_06705 [Candidatus Aminicenantes bacterium RBG_13_59_9]
MAALGLFLFAQLAQAQWTSARRLTWNSGRSEYPAIAIDSADTIHVVWDDYPFSITEIYYKRSTDGGATWSAAKTLAWTSGQSVRPAIAIDSTDTIHVVWQDDSSGNSEIYYKRSKDGGTTWSAIQNLSSTLGGSMSPATAIGSGDSVHVVWQESTPGNWEIYYKKSTDGGSTWNAARRLTWTDGESLNPAIASGDNIHIVWEDEAPGNYEIYYKRSTDGGTTWGSAKRLTWTSAGSFAPTIAMGTSGQVHVAWSDDATGNDEIYYRRSTDGGATWNGARRLTWTTGGSFSPAIAVDSSDQIHIAWHDDTSGDNEIYTKMSTDGGTTWSKIDRLTVNSGASENPAWAVDSADTLHLVWQDATPGNYEIYYMKGN